MLSNEYLNWESVVLSLLRPVAMEYERFVDAEELDVGLEQQALRPIEHNVVEGLVVAARVRRVACGLECRHHLGWE